MLKIQRKLTNLTSQDSISRIKKKTIKIKQERSILPKFKWNKARRKQEFNLAIPRFGMYLFGKIKKLSAYPKIQGHVFGYALTYPFN